MLLMFLPVIAGMTAQVPPPAPDVSQDVAWHNQQMMALAKAHGGAGWNVTKSGLRWRLVAGTGQGPKPTAKDRVTVHYTGKFADGVEFDSSVRRGEPATFGLRGLIRGWQEGIPYMSVGDTVEFIIPAHIGYGQNGRGPIPGGATLFFTVELLGIIPAE